MFFHGISADSYTTLNKNAEHIKKLPTDTTISQQMSTAGINPSGLTVSLKLIRDNFLLRRTQILLVIAAYEVMDHIEQDPP